MTDTKDDQELRAIQQVIAALSELDSEARARVISYVFQRLGISSSSALSEVAVPAATTASSTSGTAPSPPQAGRQQVDIRTFAQEKSPRSANERVAVVAYYLSELAPADDRKAEVSAADITKYFKQADFPLPGAARMTLVNAKNAGYLDTGADRGTYRLNPVGHNLVAHGLPAGERSTRSAGGRGKRGRSVGRMGKKQATRR
jgi:hypothetical protein